MKKLIIIVLILIVTFTLSSCKKIKKLGAISNFVVNDTLDNGNNSKVRVILLYGQSNATGCTNISYLEEKDSKTYDKVKNGIDNVYINFICENGNNSSNNEFVLCSLGEGASKNNFGPEIGIGLSYQEKGLKCFIIKYSWGGTILDREWLDGKYSRGELYNACINFTKASLDYLINKGYDYQIDGICWMQGESDAAVNLTRRYYKNTKAFVNYLRNDLANYQETIDFIDAGISDSKYWNKYEKINEAKEKFSNESTNNYYFSTIDIGLHYNEEPAESPDLAHYDSESELLLGRLFASYAIDKNKDKYRTLRRFFFLRQYLCFEK